ncbi:MAG: RsmD family RNA methyltransferase, partial [Planctomycetaceae bacterium]|nr:RsmD family RNA methyltransferase [Planctomycetaceae bacterium]
RPGDLVLDFFAGSGTTGEAAARHGRDAILVDSHPDAIETMRSRLAAYEPVEPGVDGIAGWIAGRR